MLKLQNVRKSYRTTHVETRALDDVSLEIQSGEFLAIMGPSGGGKSTLLNILGLLDTPDSGSYVFFDEEVGRYSQSKLTTLRRIGIGFIFQGFNLIDDLNVAENVEVALLYRGLAGAERQRKVTQALERVGIAHRSKHLPSQLSGGQQQRVAVARALACQPRLILADEPTGNLDTDNGAAVMSLLNAINDTGTTIVMVTHSPLHAAQARRTVKLLDGRIVSESQLAA